MKKRTFLKKLSAIGLSGFIPNKINNTNLEDLNHGKSYSENNFWKTVRSQYKLNSELINLENGYYNIIPNPIMIKYKKLISKINYEGSYYMRNKLEIDESKITKNLAKFIDCNNEELIITRNTTESLDLVISGYPWKKNDEAIFADHDYGAMKDMFIQVSKRYGIKNKIISIPLHPKSDQEIVELYEKQINSKTKLIMVCHMINITGQILPVKKICKMAANYGVEVMVDGAHAVGQFNLSIRDLNCDYYGSSLHKWLAAPLGTGLLYIKKKNIPKIWPLFATSTKNLEKIKKLNHKGTHPVHSKLAILCAIEYQNWIGIEKKEKRLRFLKDYWINKIKDVKNVKINTPFDKLRACGIGNFGIKSIKPLKLADILLKDYKIYTVAIDENGVKGCRVTPNLFTNTTELDRLVYAIKKIANS
jgi:selenocysteine lyase/cysteine desulfurase